MLMKKTCNITYMYIIYRYEPCSVKRGLNTFTESIDKYQPVSACAGWLGAKLFAIFKFSTCQRIILPQESDKIDFYGSDVLFAIIHHRDALSPFLQGLLFFPNTPWFLAHLSTECSVSFCNHTPSVFVRPSNVLLSVCLSTIFLLTL